MTTERQIVGVLHLASKYKYGLTSRGAPLYLFRPYDEALPDYIVGSTERDTSRNQIALVTVTTTGVPTSTLEKPRGTIVRLYGHVGDLEAEKHALLQHYCPTRHKKTVGPITELSSHMTDDQRLEICEETGWRTWHIDPPGCRDIDDAIAWNPATGAWAITIADVAAIVPEGSPADVVAATIGSTFYDLDGHVEIPMLDRQISEGLGSLLPGERRRGISLTWGPEEKEKLVLSWITVAESYTYDSFDASSLASLLNITDSHKWVEAQMIRYNAAVASMLKAYGVGSLRTQAKGDAPWADIPALSHLGTEAARYALASSDSDGHASLGLTAYTHASSPLRRYADLLNQRALHAILQNTGTSALTSACIASLNERAKANKRWSRDLTFLQRITPGRVHAVDIIWIDDDRVYVPAWARPLRLRHTPVAICAPGVEGKLHVFCDPTKPNWKRRILTADANHE